MDDDALADAWETTLPRSVSHEEHIRIARALVMRHGRDEARSRLVAGTLGNCIGMNASDRFDEDLTVRWAETVVDCVDANPGASFDDFAADHPQLLRSDLLGLPVWKREGEATGRPAEDA